MYGILYHEAVCALNYEKLLNHFVAFIYCMCFSLGKEKQIFLGVILET